ncbi:hypothetical protein NA57DRAFT_73739 [Rhizodiscina lignyota]|uniref:Uncharacterized protein n=1 Tax=Rhizodiscina lignyota TaxID=1504668 RepID=A0A9P4ME68_9PEZI|nr:hypothetical protein NA57DRAFT_73739 [Rhizodiscina lignyota]
MSSLTAPRPILRTPLRLPRRQHHIHNSRHQIRLNSQTTSSSKPPHSAPTPSSAELEEHPLLRRARLHPEDFQPTRRPPKEPPKSFHPAFTGAVAGAVASLAVCLGWYYYFGAARVMKSAGEGHRVLRERRGIVDGARSRSAVADGEREAEAKVKWLRSAARNYGQYMPSTAGWIDVAFDEVDDLRARSGKEREEVNVLVRRCYDDMEGFGKKSLGKESAKEAWDVLAVMMKGVHDIVEREKLREQQQDQEKKDDGEEERVKKGRWWMVVK